MGDPPVVFPTVDGHDRFALYSDSFAIFERMRALDPPVELRMTGGDRDRKTRSRTQPEALAFRDRIFRAST